MYALWLLLPGNCAPLLETSESTVPPTCRGEELLGLLQKPTVRESATADKFRTAGTTAVREYCQHLTKEDCCR